MLIIPAIFTDNPQELKNFFTNVSGKFERIQVDINDGSFLGKKTIIPDSLIGVDQDLAIDFHLMVKEPINWVDKCLQAAAERIIGQIELMGSQKNFVGKIQEEGAKVGLALDINTPVSALDRSVLGDVDIVLLMAYQAGKPGQNFDESVLPKISELVELRKEDPTPFKICVDGGVWSDNIKRLFYLGVDEVAIGRRLLEGDIQDNIRLLKGELKL